MAERFASYNYENFRFGPYKELFRNFPNVQKLGSEAPDFECADINGNRVSLSDHRGRFVVLEFGCLTCAPAATQLAIYPTSISRRLVPMFSGEEVDFIMIYTREAHPGELVPAHSSFNEKAGRARQFKEIDDLKLKVLVDDLEGTIHKKYGELPNMAYIIDRQGKIVYKASWTDAGDVETSLRNLLLSEKGAKARRTLGVVEKLIFIEDDNVELHSSIYARGGRQSLEEVRRELGLDV
ncbi:MAG: redoxin domain-containing protein [Candidatus Micrarchaeota archaeon]|nr:redoxin domain-containing protein [Candidatus Micrarchaeota archaeon]MDE1859776.1 redoxin domain-containing protein [Candidatus Micrarchaeota archaeon]